MGDWLAEWGWGGGQIGSWYELIAVMIVLNTLHFYGVPEISSTVSYRNPV